MRPFSSRTSSLISLTQRRCPLSYALCHVNSGEHGILPEILGSNHKWPCESVNNITGGLSPKGALVDDVWTSATRRVCWNESDQDAA
ncbi:hypothetical protein DACRYDRAFT_23803 [Dacryopinax primogenitus]|uniref:Uncharacterized protein n=1 Tax=Dacryopinax primogenitus (strain DJM 731) TaxID=1858805 RepID=M5FQL7_DACPD|nr:uncharacterized protein DACRYDRAFT_23803 [Dacryopinax primogenitus]EJT99185.1 hypothetical protein DACRYDRAFT_23803 [Dacryopinax primogenitus]